jgi:hypothetical protein
MIPNATVAIHLLRGCTYSTSCGGWLEENVQYACVQDELGVGQSVQWGVTFSGAVRGLKFLQAFAYAEVTDAHAENDVASCFIPTGAEIPAGAQDRMELPVRTLLYSSARRKLYGAIPAAVPWHGNSLIEIDPVTSEVRGPLFVGSEPVALAATDDGQSLYVSLYGIGGMRRVALDSWSVDSPFPVGAGVEAAVAVPNVPNGVVLTHGVDASVFFGGSRTSYVLGPISRLVRGPGIRVWICTEFAIHAHSEAKYPFECGLNSRTLERPVLWCRRGPAICFREVVFKSRRCSRSGSSTGVGAIRRFHGGEHIRS